MAENPQQTHVNEDEEDKAENSSSDDDSSSSSSGSSSSSSSSDSESEDEAEAENADAKQGAPHGATGGRTGQSNPSGTSGPALSAPRPHGMAANTETLNVNSTRAVARFKAAETEAMMPLGTRKRDRRTIEEIQRDLRDKRKKPLGTPAARSSPPPPKGSPVRSPEADAVMNSGAPMAVGGPLGSFGTAGRLPIKRKPVSAHDRLAMKLNGRRTTSAKTKKAASSTAGNTTITPVSVMTNKTVTKPMTATSSMGTATGNSSSSDHGGDAGADGYSSSVSRSSAPAVDGKVVRAMLRAMLRYGDLTDVGLYPTAANFADEYKMPSFIERSNLPTTTKVPIDHLHTLANEVAQKAKQAVEARPPHDNIKIAEVEARSTQIIERLFENLKLRVAVQRALRTAGCSSGNAQVNAQGAYVLVAKQSDLSVLGVNTRDLPNWTWAEKEHDWTQRKDAALLLGVYVHGFGGWEDILNDDLLHFQGQRALKGERLKKRAENLLKRLPAPDLDAGDPRIVQQASSLSSAGANSNQSLGAQFSAIIHSGAIPGVTASIPANSGTGGGRMARAAERFAARQQNGDEVVGRRHTGSSNGTGTSNGQGLESGRQNRTPLMRSPAQSSVVDNEAEEGEIGGASPAQSTSSRHKKRSSSVEDEDRTSSRKKHRSESSTKKEKWKKEHRRSERSETKTSETPAVVVNAVAEVAPLPLLSADECYEKWKPDKKLREIRQELKKLKIMAKWSRNQKDETVVEKVFKYVSTIGGAIDCVVTQHEDNAERHHSDASAREVDELCTCLWTYAAGFTPFTPQGFERLYDDICADGDALVATKS
ncbi:hypothetical protein PHYPSEUDO_000195 [Phytophthora pseudosyringae]|uniref:ATP-dependent helicase CHD1-2/hrp3 HTH domain-containing protein n=1 Tax=Phytophthora pseudosyringae TaxID=221518 RepID=A0A8T1WFF9_9STRA|nr:hypothetical protein PHYPSEUDO_000195 [Phytophthora pseudosyringae]